MGRTEAAVLSLATISSVRSARADEFPNGMGATSSGSSARSSPNPVRMSLATTVAEMGRPSAPRTSIRSASISR